MRSVAQSLKKLGSRQTMYREIDVELQQRQDRDWDPLPDPPSLPPLELDRSDPYWPSEDDPFPPQMDDRCSQLLPGEMNENPSLKLMSADNRSLSSQRSNRPQTREAQ